MAADKEENEITKLLNKLEKETQLIQKVRKAQMQKDFNKEKTIELQKKKQQEELKLEIRIAEKHDKRSKTFFIISVLLCLAVYVISLSRQERTTFIEYGIYCFLIFGMYLAKKTSRK